MEQLRARGNTRKTIRLTLTAISSFYEWLIFGSWVKVTENHHENRMHGIHFGSKHPLHQLLALFSSSRTRPIFERQVKTDPAAEVRRRLQTYKTDGEEQTHKIISVEEAAELVQSLVDIRDKSLVLLLLKTGICRGELLSLDVDFINWQNHSVLLKPTKKRTNRIVFFDEEAAYYLKRWLAVREGRRGSEGAALFLSTRGQRLQRSGIDAIVRRGALQAGLHDASSERMEDHFSAHAARHFLPLIYSVLA